MRDEIRLKIADIVFSLSATWNGRRLLLDDNHLLFMADESPDFILRLKKKPPHNIQYTKEKFSSSTWSYLDSGKKQIFLFFSSAKGKHRHHERTLVVKPVFKRADVIVSELRTKGPTLRHPFAYPLDQILVISLLPCRRGLLAHSCGFSYKNRGYLFIGSSGAGKTTLAQILEKSKCGPVLGDDRIIIREKSSHLYIYGTPWSGEGGIVSADRALLNALFFLKKDVKNHLCRLSIADTVLRLMRHSFLSFWDREGISLTLKLCEDIAKQIPAFEFSFTPDRRAFDLIKKQIFNTNSI